MSIESQRVKLFEVVNNLMAANYPDIPVHWPNRKSDQPDGTFLWVNMILGEQQITNLGSYKTFRHISMFQIDIYTPVDTGTKEISELADFLAKNLREREFQLSDGDRLLVKPPQMATPSAARGFARIMLRFPIWRDER